MATRRRTVYLETSFVSACGSTRGDAKSIYRRDASLEWWDTQRRHFDLFVSLEVIAELKNPNYPRSAAAQAWIAEVPLLPITDEVRGIAQLLIAEFLMPQAMSGDAIHAAVAAHHGVNHILSWNVQHLANPNKRNHFRKVLGRLGIIAPEISTPELLTED